MREGAVVVVGGRGVGGGGGTKYICTAQNQTQTHINPHDVQQTTTTTTTITNNRSPNRTRMTVVTVDNSDASQRMWGGGARERLGPFVDGHCHQANVQHTQRSTHEEVWETIHSRVSERVRASRACHTIAPLSEEREENKASNESHNVVSGITTKTA